MKTKGKTDQEIETALAKMQEGAYTEAADHRQTGPEAADNNPLLKQVERAMMVPFYGPADGSATSVRGSTTQHQMTKVLDAHAVTDNSWLRTDKNPHNKFPFHAAYMVHALLGVNVCETPFDALRSSQPDSKSLALHFYRTCCKKLAMPLPFAKMKPCGQVTAHTNDDKKPWSSDPLTTILYLRGD